MCRQKSRQAMDAVARFNLVQPILAAHPDTQAIYLYGTWGTEYQRRDNDLIYNLIVQNIRETKTKRQIIVVTHNANIVVNGDAEMVHCLTVVGGQSHITSGSLQSKIVRERICNTLEGGSKAFEQRYKRIHLEF